MIMGFELGDANSMGEQRGVIVIIIIIIVGINFRGTST